MRVVSARWVIPIDRPPIADGALALDDDGTIRAVGTRADVRAAFPDAPEERGRGRAGPRPRQRALPPGAVRAGRRRSGRRRPGPVGAASHEGRRRDRARGAARGGRCRRRVAAVRLGTAAIGDVGNSLDAAPAIGEAGLTGVLFHELVGSREAATGDALADAARERERRRRQLAGRRWATCPLRTPPTPSARTCSGASSRRPLAAGQGTSVHVAEDADELALLRDGSGRWADLLRTMGVDPGVARARQDAGRLSRRAGRLRRPGAAAAGPHGSRRGRGPPHRARGRRDRRALPAVEPAHRRSPAPPSTA